MSDNVITEEEIQDRENVSNLLKQLSRDCNSDAAFIVLRRNGTVDALWYGDPLIIHSLAMLGKRAIWTTLLGSTQPKTHDIDQGQEDTWDINKLDV